MENKILGNRYEILEEIGSGGMAKVYKAKCKLLNRFVAVKVLRDDLKNDSEFVRRFNVESQAAASLSHTNVVPIYDVGEENGVHYIVMEYVEGVTLKEYIEQNGSLEWLEALNFAVQICRGLEVAHKNFIVHRDIKPHNIIVTRDKVLKVTDFGIARANNEATMTLEGNTIGSVHYLSPEQARGGYTDEKTDIYSLGVVLYEMTTGRVPFGATNESGETETAVAIALKHIQDEPTPPRELNLAIPKSVENVILKAMAKDQLSRYSSATGMLNDLEKVIRNPDVRIDIAMSALEHTSTMHMPAIKDGDIKKIRKNPEARQQKMDEFFESDQPRKSKPTPTRNKKDDKKVVALAVISAIIIFAIIIGAVGCMLGCDEMFEFFGCEAAVAVPNLAELDIDIETAQERYGNSFNIELRRRVEHEAPEGIIVAQTFLAATNTIQVDVSRGPENGDNPNGDEEYEITLRNFMRTDYNAAVSELEAYGIIVVVNYESSLTYPVDTIVSQFPATGSTVRTGDTVTFRVSTGPEEDDDDDDDDDTNGNNGTITPPPAPTYSFVMGLNAPATGQPTRITIRVDGQQIYNEVHPSGASFSRRITSPRPTAEVEVLNDGVSMGSQTVQLFRD